MGIASFKGLPRIPWKPDRIMVFIRNTLRGSPLATVEKKPRYVPHTEKGYWLDVAFKQEGRRLETSQREEPFVPYTDGLWAFALLADCPFLLTSGLSRALYFRERKNRDNFILGIKRLARRDRLEKTRRRESEFVLTDAEKLYLSIYALTCGEWQFRPLEEGAELWRCGLEITDERSSAIREFARLAGQISKSDTPVFRTRGEAEFFMREFERIAREVHAEEENWTKNEREQNTVRRLGHAS